MIQDRKKLRLRFNVRVILAAMTGAILGGGIVATVGPAMHPFFYAGSSTPDWAAVWTMRWNAALFFAAVLSFIAASVAVVYAKRGVETVLMTEQLKRTEAQVSRFEQADLQAAYNEQVEAGKGGLAARQVAAEQRFTTKKERDQMVDLVNYLGWVTTLTDTGLLNEELYFNRHGPAVVMIYVALLRVLTSMHKDRMIDLEDLRRFAVRAYRHMKANRYEHRSLDEVALSAAGDDLEAVGTGSLPWEAQRS
jgi:hypothetical protein